MVKEARKKQATRDDAAGAILLYPGDVVVVKNLMVCSLCDANRTKFVG